MAIEWQRLQNEYYYDIGNTSKYRSGKIWTKGIIQTIWTQWKEVWLLRNEVIHGHDIITKNRAKRTTAVRKLTRIYALRHQMLPSHTELLFPTLEEHLLLSTKTITNWITVHETLIDSGIKEATLKAITGTKSIRSYFTPNPRIRSPRPSNG